jgi:hypothetical protein
MSCPSDLVLPHLRLEASLRRATPKGHETFISRTAPQQGPFLHQVLLAFRTHIGTHRAARQPEHVSLGQHLREDFLRAIAGSNPGAVKVVGCRVYVGVSVPVVCRLAGELRAVELRV